MKKIAIVPTLFTLGNGICGFAAVTFAAKITADTGDDQVLQLLATSGWLILAAMLFDMLDGRMARLAKVPTEFGSHLDSLCDVISFGVAPAFLLLKLSPAFPGKVLWMLAALYVICAALRLARFNVETDLDAESHFVFSGLPSPAAAGAIASVAIMLEGLTNYPLLKDRLDQPIETGLPFAALALALLMVSRIPYAHLTNQMFHGYHSFQHLVKVVFALVAILMIRELSLPLIFWAFVIGAPVRAFWETVILRRPQEEPLF